MEWDYFKPYLFIFDAYLLLLAKIFNFCKYVRLTVCYLPKFSILASMFVWRFVCLSVCLSVCLFVCNIHDTGRTVQAINTKLGTYIYLGSGYGCIVFGVYDVIDDVIRSKNRSNFKIAITPSIFELELRSKAQNVGYWTGYLGDIPNFRWHLWRKSSPRPQIFVSFKNFVIFNIAWIWQQVSKDSMQIIYQDDFHNYDLTNDVTA